MRENYSLITSFHKCLIYIVFLNLCQCVGPTSPFGTVGVNDELPKREMASEKSYIEIIFHPQKQVYHDRADFSLEIKSQEVIDDQTKVQVLHNGFDVTESFLQNAHIHRSTDGKSFIYTIKDLRLKTLDPNDIQVRLKKGAQIVSSTPFKHPDCSLFKKKKLSRKGIYHVPSEYISVIEKMANEHSTNPSFLAGLVAQESGFNPKAVSWAKAIGLTQMTPLAEEQIESEISSWPRHPGINDLSYLTLKYKISAGDISDSSEWRLNPEMSLKGGLAYLNYLENYWNQEANKKLVDELGGDREKAFTEIVLASYNSGAARVKNAVINSNKNWKKQSNLKEALRYIRKVTSYCYHYSNNEVINENET
jgi:hypothetical protein